MLKVAIVGPESSGKTSLANDLASGLSVRVVPEFARTYLSALGRQYDIADFKAMVVGQMAWENWYAQLQPKVLLCDTNHVVFQIWAEESYGQTDSLVENWAENDHVDLYLLCAPDMPWEPDALREHPNDRERLFDRYEALLLQKQYPFVALSGNRQERKDIALDAIGRLNS